MKDAMTFAARTIVRMVVPSRGSLSHSALTCGLEIPEKLQALLRKALRKLMKPRHEAEVEYPEISKIGGLLT